MHDLQRELLVWFMAPLIEHDIQVSQTRLMALNCREGILFKSKRLHQLAKIMHQHNSGFTVDADILEMDDVKSAKRDRSAICISPDLSDQDIDDQNIACDSGHSPTVVQWHTDRSSDDSETSDDDVTSMQLEAVEEDSCYDTASSSQSTDHRRRILEDDPEDDEDIHRISDEPSSSSESNVQNSPFVIRRVQWDDC